MTNVVKQSRSTLRVYGTGGAGINTALNLKIPENAAGFPDCSIALVDTSRSNLPTKNLPNCEVFIVPGIDGSGKDRAFAYKQALPNVDNILLNCPPKSFNIIIFGASGGSGSVLGPLLLQELLRRGEQAIGVCITSTSDAKQAINAHNTMGTLQNIATKVLNKPILCCFYENSINTPRGAVDIRIESDIRAISMLISGSNEEMDKKDIGNLLNYHTVTGIKPQLTDLIVYIKEKDKSDLTGISAIGVANLLVDKADTELSLGQLYSATGYCSPGTKDAYSNELPNMHFIATNQFMGDRINKLDADIKMFSDNETKLLTADVPQFHDGADSSPFLF